MYALMGIGEQVKRLQPANAEPRDLPLVPFNLLKEIM
jgi:hypothetical protein